MDKEELNKHYLKGENIDKYKIKKPEQGIHSEMHALAKDISEYCGEPRKFAMYLGIIKNIGIREAYRIFSEIKQNKQVETPGKLFVYMSANESRKNKPNKKNNGNNKRSK